MSSSAPVPDFVTFLACNLPAGYPIDTPFWLQIGVAVKEAVKRQLVQQETAFLDIATPLVATHPWLAYLAALKHEAVLALTTIDSTPFVDINEQKFYKDAQNRWRLLKRDARAATDDAIAFFCERLVHLQREELKIEDAIKGMEAAIAAGYPALEPRPDPPVEPVRGLFGVSKEKTAEYDAALKKWQHQESYLGICQLALKVVLAMPAKNKQDLLRDLPACVTALKNLRDERAHLVATYVTPYFG